ncbi:hypothetical protein ACI5KX_05815 [Erythrobacter sp. GH1-10]|uniref:hypothetical protein n=1 Tax=Erythrobacter sp. GH1-10 TaxID=3349334 RepID=UPI003877C4C0
MASRDEPANLPLSQIEFDLADPGGAAAQPSGRDGDQVRVQKPLFADGSSIGTVTVTIDENARLFVNGSDVKRLLGGLEDPPGQLSRIAEGQPVSFQRLRQLGIDLRYVPTTDRIELNR